MWFRVSQYPLDLDQVWEPGIVSPQDHLVGYFWYYPNPQCRKSPIHTLARVVGYYFPSPCMQVTPVLRLLSYLAAGKMVKAANVIELPKSTRAMVFLPFTVTGIK